MVTTPHFIECSWRVALLTEQLWYGNHPLKWLLWPVSLLFGAVSACRRTGYRLGLLQSQRLPVPVIIVGNISVGGTGKTPLTVWLVNHLIEQGWRPGIVSRGYGGEAASYPLSVTASSRTTEAGDEPVLLATRTACPLVVDPKRVRAAQTLLERETVDIIISDDGLQHYALQRDIELVVVDAERRCGNGMLLPAGPLRESRSRLQQVDAVLINGAADTEAGFHLQAGKLCSLMGGEQQALATLAGRKVHALAGIGNPQRFYNVLREAGLELIVHSYPDHHAYTKSDICFNDDLPVLMTEKDAVKCKTYADERHWYLPVDAVLNAQGMQRMEAALEKLPAALKKT